MMRNFLFLGVFIASAGVHAGGRYDEEMLKALGYNAEAADLLDAGAHFLPGDHPTNILVNGLNKGLHVITFDQSGTPCWSEALLRSLGIDSQGFHQDDAGTCLRPITESEIRIIEQVEQASIELQVPLSGLLSDAQYTSGGKALIVNYDARRYQYRLSSGSGHSSETMTSEIGANINNWILRSGQSYASFDNQSTFTRLYGYAQRSVPGWASVVQIGEITSDDPLFSGISLTGAQLVPENALQNGGANRVSLETLMSQAGTVEVYQGNILLKTFQVGAGVVTLDSIPAVNQRDDFLLISHDDSGNRQQRTIPFIQARPEITLLETGASIAAGRLRLAEDEYPLLLGSIGVYQSRWLAVLAGVLVSEDYQAASWRANMLLTEHLLATLSQTTSFARNTVDDNEQQRGQSHQLTLSYPVTDRLSLNTSVNFRSRGYVDTSSSGSTKQTAEEAGQIKAQYAAGLSYKHPWLGALTFSGSQSQSWKGTTSLGYVLGWGKSFGDVNVNLGVQKNRLSDDRQRIDSRYIYLNISVALGRNRSWRSWVSNNDRQTRTGVGYDQTVNDKFAWSLSGEKGQKQDSSIASSATWTNKYSQLSGGASYRENNASYNIGARGGAVLHGDGLTFTPRKVGDTFGVISLNSDQSDVEISTPTGKVWSDRSGHAISTWTPWLKNTVRINNKSLPKNVQVAGGIADVTPYRGAVVPVILPASTVRRALVSFQGEGPVVASAVKDGKGRLIAFVNEDGTIFFDDLPEGALFGQLKDGARCTIELLSPWLDDPSTLYASLSARCVL